MDDRRMLTIVVEKIFNDMTRSCSGVFAAFKTTYTFRKKKVHRELHSGVLPSMVLGILWVLRFPPPVQRHAGKQIGYVKHPLSVNECVCVCWGGGRGMNSCTHSGNFTCTHNNPLSF